MHEHLYTGDTIGPKTLLHMSMLHDAVGTAQQTCANSLLFQKAMARLCKARLSFISCTVTTHELKARTRVMWDHASSIAFMQPYNSY